MKAFGFLAALALAACVETAEVPVPSPGTPVITFGEGGPFNGGVETQVFANDVIVHTSFGPFDRSPDRRVRQGWPGAFAALRAALEEKGPTAARTLRGNEPACTDYGSDFVTADPPVAGLTSFGAGCPNPAMTALLATLRSSLVRPE